MMHYRKKGQDYVGATGDHILYGITSLQSFIAKEDRMTHLINAGVTSSLTLLSCILGCTASTMRDDSFKIPDGIKCYVQAKQVKLQVSDKPFVEHVQLEDAKEGAGSLRGRGVEVYAVVVDSDGKITFPLVRVRRLRRGFFERPYYPETWALPGGGVGDGQPFIDVPLSADIAKYVVIVRDWDETLDSSKWRYSEIEAKEITGNVEPSVKLEALEKLKPLRDRDDSERILKLLKTADETRIDLNARDD